VIVQTKDSKATSDVNLDFSKSAGAGFPGRAYSYVLIGRNVDQWRNSMDVSDKDVAGSVSTTPGPKGLKIYLVSFLLHNVL
jgi:hypothetical protein